MTWFCDTCAEEFSDGEMSGDDYAPLCPGCGNPFPTKVK